jgi:uncharacterized protein (TIGR02145 family)
MRFPITKATLISMSAMTGMALCGLFSTHCKKFDISRQIIVKTVDVSDITASSCKVTGALLDMGESGVTQHGFCWSRSPDPAEAIGSKSQGPASERGSFFDVIEGLSPGTIYFIWAFAADSEGRVYGDAREFSTVPAQIPVVETGGVVNITPTSAQCEYNVVSDGGAQVLERGLCWNTAAAPTINDAHTTEGTGTGAYTGTMNGLNQETDYFVRAFAINSAGEAYGQQRTFATPPGAGIPIVHTDPVVSKTATTALVSGSISDDGGAEIGAKGICWNTEPDPTLENHVLNAGGGPDPFELTIEELTPNTTYYVRAFAVNSAGTGYGELQEFTTNPEPLVDERDGTIYQTVRIGEQVWMAQNLNVGEIIDGSVTATDNEIIEKYCYNNDPDACEVYGGMYSWPEMMQYNYVESNKGICPEGWHIPSDDEWKILEIALGMGEEVVSATDWRGTDEGGRLKVTGFIFWFEPNTGATNESGFSALGAGELSPADEFMGLGGQTLFWTSSWIEPFPWMRALTYDHADVLRYQAAAESGLSVRCVKD